MAIISKYGRNFDAGWKNADGYVAYDDLGIEMWNIQQGDEYLKSQGRSLAFHYENCRKILWPKLDAHRWHTLCRDEVLSHKVCVLLGCGSSGKTHEAAWISLLDYWCHPNDTCILVSSTDVRGLKKRIWGEIAMLWEQGVEKFPKLSGHLLDSAIAITTDDIEDCDPGARKSRDMRKGIFGVPCFLPDEMVDTPSGAVPIKDIKIGDCVINASGIGIVKETHCRTTDSIIEVIFSDGRKVKCTPEHPFFTERGWVSAVDLETCERVYSPHEALQMLRKSTTPRIPKSETLQRYLQNQITREGMQILQTEIQAIQEKTKLCSRWEVLQHGLRGKMGRFKARTFRKKVKMPALQKNNSEGVYQPEILRCDLPLKTDIDAMRYVRDEVCIHSRKPEQATHNLLRKILQDEIHIKIEREEARNDHRSRNEGVEHVQEFSSSLSSKNGIKNCGWKASLVPTGFGVSEIKVGNRNRRWSSQHPIEGGVRQKTRRSIQGARVVSVKVHKSPSGKEPSCSKGEYTVHNLEVENHPSYSVSGFLVHNCVQGGKFVGLQKFVGIKQKRMRLVADEASMMGESFLSAFANLNKNEDFRAIILGNPNDPLDPLGRAAEPKEGWTDEYMEPTKTKVWDTRFMNGRCVNLIGLDSPNFDFPPEKPTKFKYLISKEKIDDTLSFFQKDSIEYYSQCVGSMKIGTMARRVISRHLCQQFGALDDVVWHGEKPMRICGLDAAYGGDRCVCGYIEFGPSVSGQIIFRFTPPVVVPIKVNASVIPEDQIAAFVRDFCRENEIPPENFFHDSTGRGTLGTAIARLWSDKCNPVEFGGNATDRPVSKDLYITDEKTGQRRLKRCDEHYSNFVAELWYSVRYAIESNSVRNLPQDVMEEMSMREWDWIKGQKKIALETKVDMKMRVGRSPDLGDWASICMEGARRRGFQIPKLGLADTINKPRVDDWFIKQYEKTQALNKSRQLQAA